MNTPETQSGSSLQRLVRRFIVEIHDDITPAQALYYCMKITQGGEVSGPNDRRQHCYHTTFKNGASVSCVKRGKSERFIVEHAKSPNEKVSDGGDK